MAALDFNEIPDQEPENQKPDRKGQISKRALQSLHERAADIARALLGPENPEHSTTTELRWGTNGSISIEIAGSKSGDYYNHERKIGGGPLQLLAIEGGMTMGTAIDWLHDTLGIEIERDKPRKSLNERIVTTYDYQDEHGNLLFQIARLADPKDFRQRHPDGKGGWEWNVKGIRLVPYRLPELLTSTGTVYIVEGEKDADRLAALGMPATTNPGGAGKWPADFAQFFAHRDIIILPDNDKAGAEHAEMVSRSLAMTAACVRVVSLPGLGPKGDVSDWLDAGGTREALEHLIADARESSPPVAPGDLIDPDAPYMVARQFTSRNYTSSELCALRHHRETFYAWSGAGAYREVSEDTIRAQLYAYLACCTEIDNKGRQYPVKPDKALVNNVFDALRASTHLDDNITAPCWLGAAAAPPDELIACANGLLHLPTMRLLPHSPRFFTLNALEFAFDPDAPDPVEWLKFMGTLWPDDPDSINTLQDMFGLALTGETRYQKAFLLIGPPRCGKGTIARVITRLIGQSNIVAPVLSSLGTDFGLAPLLGKRLAIVSDARLSARADQAAIAERILSITGEDVLTVARKYKDAWTGQLHTRFLILSNELPGIADASGALANRFVILVFSQSFLGREDHGLTDRLLRELSGILNWSIAGWQRLRERGYFVQPQSSCEVSQDFAELGSPISSFIKDVCETGSGYTVLADDLYKVWCWWCEEQGRHKPGTKQIFGRNLRAALPRLKVARPRDDAGTRPRFYEGMRIKPVRQAEASEVDLNEVSLQQERPQKTPWWVN